jgi:hypothetical protein
MALARFMTSFVGPRILLTYYTSNPVVGVIVSTSLTDAGRVNGQEQPAHTFRIEILCDTSESVLKAQLHWCSRRYSALVEELIAYSACMPA